MTDITLSAETVREAGVYTARGVHELHMMVSSLAAEGFQIVTVIDTQNGDYHVVAQRFRAEAEGR